MACLVVQQDVQVPIQGGAGDQERSKLTVAHGASRGDWLFAEECDNGFEVVPDHAHRPLSYGQHKVLVFIRFLVFCFVFRHDPFPRVRPLESDTDHGNMRIGET